MNELLKQGNKRPLENDDLPPLLKEDQSQELTQNLECLWFLSSNKSGHIKCENWIKTARLWRALLRLVPTSEKVFVMTLAYLHMVLCVTQPLFLIGLIADLAKQYPLQQPWIYFHAAGVCLCTWLIVICKCHCDYRSSMIGMRLRSAILGLIYKKVGYTGVCLTG